MEWEDFDVACGGSREGADDEGGETHRRARWRA